MHVIRHDGINPNPQIEGSLPTSSGMVVVAPIPSENITSTRATLPDAADTSFNAAIAASNGQPRAAAETNGLVSEGSFSGQTSSVYAKPDKGKEVDVAPVQRKRAAPAWPGPLGFRTHGDRRRTRKDSLS